MINVDWISESIHSHNKWNKLSTDCVNASNMNIFKHNIYNCFRRAG